MRETMRSGIGLSSFIPFYKVDSYYRNTVNQSVPVIPLSPYPRQVVLECTVKCSENLVSKPEHIKTDTPPRATDCDARLTDRLATVLLISLCLSLSSPSRISTYAQQTHLSFIHALSTTSNTEPLTIRSYNDNDGVDNDD